MKKLLLSFIILFVITLVSCDLSINNQPHRMNVDYKIDEINEGVLVTINYSLNESIKDNIIEYGFMYDFNNEVVELLDDSININKKIVHEEPTENKHQFIIPNIGNDNYRTKLNIRGYIKTLENDNEKVIYSKQDIFTLYELAKNHESEFAKIVRSYRIYIDEIEVELNTKEYKVIRSPDFIINQVWTDYQIIKLTLTVNNDLQAFKEDSVLIFNGVTINSNMLDISPTKIVYTFDDPNSLYS